MKHSKIIISFIILICSIGCTEQTPFDPLMPNYWGYVEAKFNGEIWQPSPYGIRSWRNHSRLTIKMHRRNSNAEIRESLTIANVPKAIGLYIITAGNPTNGTEVGAVLSTLLSDGDVFDDYFRYDSTLGQSFVQIMEWDSTTGNIEGTFDIKLLRSDFGPPNLDYPDTLNIEGTFKTKFDMSK